LISGTALQLQIGELHFTTGIRTLLFGSKRLHPGMAQKEIASRAFIQPGPSLIERLNTGNLEEQNSHSIRSQPFASILAWMEVEE
jgi:hypothetical protein